MNEEFLNRMSAEIKALSDDELIMNYAMVYQIVASNISDDKIAVIFAEDMPEVKNMQDVQSLMANVFGPEFVARGIDDQKIEEVILEVKSGPGMTAKERMIVAGAAVVGAGILGFGIGPVLSKHCFPNHKGLVMTLLTLAGAALGLWAGMTFVSAQANKISKQMLENLEQAEAEKV